MRTLLYIFLASRRYKCLLLADPQLLEMLVDFGKDVRFAHERVKAIRPWPPIVWPKGRATEPKLVVHVIERARRVPRDEGQFVSSLPNAVYDHVDSSIETREQLMKSRLSRRDDEPRKTVETNLTRGRRRQVAIRDSTAFFKSKADSIGRLIVKDYASCVPWGNQSSAGVVRLLVFGLFLVDFLDIDGVTLTGLAFRWENAVFGISPEIAALFVDVRILLHEPFRRDTSGFSDFVTVVTSYWDNKFGTIGIGTCSPSPTARGIEVDSGRARVCCRQASKHDPQKDYEEGLHVGKVEYSSVW